MANRKRPLVVVTRKLPDSVETRLRELFDARLNLEDKPLSQAQLAETVKTADVLVPTVTDRIDSTVLSKAGDKLKSGVPLVSLFKAEFKSANDAVRVTLGPKAPEPADPGEKLSPEDEKKRADELRYWSV